jgi:hypothetical protein
MAAGARSPHRIVPVGHIPRRLFRLTQVCVGVNGVVRYCQIKRVVCTISDTGKDSSQKLTDVSYRRAAGPCNPPQATTTSRERSSSPPSPDQPSQVRILRDADDRGRALRRFATSATMALEGFVLEPSVFEPLPDALRDGVLPRRVGAVAAPWAVAFFPTQPPQGKDHTGFEPIPRRLQDPGGAWRAVTIPAVRRRPRRSGRWHHPATEPRTADV